MLEVSNHKIDFIGIFNKYIKTASAYSRYGGYYDDYDEYDVYGCFPGYDDDYDWWEEYENMKSKKAKKGSSLVWDKDRGEFVSKERYDKTHSKNKKHSYEDEDYDDYEDWDDYLRKNKNKNKRGGRGSKKKNKTIYTETNIDNNNGKTFDDINDFAYNDENKYIYFYPDITKKEIRDEFNSLHEFDEFISNNDINITETDVKYLMKNTLVHCTAITNADGKKQLVTDNSWGSLVWSCEETKNLIDTQWD